MSRPLFCSPGAAGRLAAPVLVALAYAVAAFAENPLALKVEISDVQSYTGAPLPKPTMILVYDFVVNTKDVQVDKSQKIRPRHLVMGDEKPGAVAKKALDSFSKELVKKLAKTGIPVQHTTTGVVPAEGSLVVQGTFLSLQQGDKTERVVLGMGTGSAEIKSSVDVRLKTSADAVRVVQFQTETKPGANVGVGIPIAAGLNPASAAMKSTVGDRRKNVDTYASKTADAAAQQIVTAMTQQGWIKPNGKDK